MARRNERGELEFERKQNARKVQYPGLTLGQQPVKSNMRTLCLHQFYTSTSGQDVCICLDEKARNLEIQRHSGKWKSEHMPRYTEDVDRRPETTERERTRRKSVQQGCRCSPAFFSIDINKPAVHIKPSAYPGLTLQSKKNKTKLFFADDLVLLLITGYGLQRLHLSDVLIRSNLRKCFVVFDVTKLTS